MLLTAGRTPTVTPKAKGVWAQYEYAESKPEIGIHNWYCLLCPKKRYRGDFYDLYHHMISEHEKTEEEIHANIERFDIGVKCSDPNYLLFIRGENFTDISVDHQDRVNEILAMQNPIDGVRAELDNIIAGEEYNKVTLFLLLLNFKGKNLAEDAQLLLLLGDAGSGKTHLINVALLFDNYPVNTVTNSSIKGLGKQLKGKTCFIVKDLCGLDYEQDLRFMSPDDSGQMVFVLRKRDKDGNWITAEERVDRVNLVSATTERSIKESFKRRHWFFYPNTSADQTKRVLAFKIHHQREKQEVRAKKIRQTSFDRSRDTLRHLIKTIPTVEVRNPMIATLTDILTPPNAGEPELVIRSHVDKVINAVRFATPLFYQQLPKYTDNKQEWVVLTPSVLMKILDSLKEAVGNLITNLPKRAVTLLEAIKQRGLEKGVAWYKADHVELAQDINKSDKTVAEILRSDLSEYISSTKGKDGNEYILLHDPIEILYGRAFNLTAAWVNDLFTEAREQLTTTYTEYPQLWSESEFSEIMTHFNDTAQDQVMIHPLIKPLEPITPHATSEESKLEEWQHPIKEVKKQA